MTKALKEQVVADILKAKKHLEYSYQKVLKISLSKELGEEELETLESFSSRFSRISDLYIAKYFRVLMLEKDPAFRGSVVDLLNQAEKYSWISSSEKWLRIRELRNLAAHEYAAIDYIKLYHELIQLTPLLLKIDLHL